MASFVRPDVSSDSRALRLTRWERDDIGKERRLRLSKYELIREDTAHKLRCPLCFCFPCAIIAFILLILIGIYIVQPYVRGKYRLIRNDLLSSSRITYLIYNL